ncbi:hypothetical protein [Massilia sp. CF038]|uniref:hypothetical protein n=1 Tax=Massilia sp. CF038 TaxID=1881045 RepID=UPI00091810CC|nr:hypothetical protein [Massilia sp. CF038]SHG35588.1 hypothetical protein SAMN05428948_0052 [Massilia sp. CF038]
MKLFRLLPLLALAALPALADAPLRIVKSDTGYRFSAKTKSSEYAFEVPGKTIRTSEKDHRIFAMIDGAMLQVLRVPASAGTEEEALAAHRQTESAFLEKSGATVSESSHCASLAVPHAAWQAELADVSVSRYLTVKIDETILVLVVASNVTTPSGVADKQMDSICSTFQR